MRPQHLYNESRHRSLWSLQITIILTEKVLLIFLQSGVEKMLASAAGGWTHVVLSRGAYDLSATANRDMKDHLPMIRL